MMLEIARARLLQVIVDRQEQGFDVGDRRLRALTADEGELQELALELAALPLRPDWEYVEPDDIDGIRRESDPTRPVSPLALPEDVPDRIEAAFLGSVCGCILGKPVEFDPTLEELRTALTAVGDWPLDDYVSERVLTSGALPRLHVDWPATVRERIAFAAPDDDINYTILGMLVLERHGASFTRADLAQLWLEALPVGWTFGPERTVLVRLAESTLGNRYTIDPDEVDGYAALANPGDERCGAMIRADAYGYACPGDPGTASMLAQRDARLTHRRTGVYGAMFAAALIAGAFSIDDPLELARTALGFVPQRSRFHLSVADCIDEVARATDWLDGYERIHRKYGDFGHCRIYQETGTLINTLRFAQDVGSGICMQVMQGNDTDSYGATAGSILGARFGTRGLERRWLEPFQDRLHSTVAVLHENSLSAVARRMSRLPELLRTSEGTS